MRKTDFCDGRKLAKFDAPHLGLNWRLGSLGGASSLGSREIDLPTCQTGKRHWSEQARP